MLEMRLVSILSFIIFGADDKLLQKKTPDSHAAENVLASASG
jgi:hypothetical protein